MNKVFIQFLKYGISAGIIAYLVIDAQSDKTFAQLIDQPKRWDVLFLAWLACLLAVALTIVRWHVLVRALDLPFSLRDAFRLGFLGYLLNFISLGSVGGDLFKAVFMAREQPGRRAEAVATVVVDRVIGLFMLFVLATIAILCTGQLHSSVREIQVICQGTIAATAVGTAAMVVLMIPGVTQGAFSEFLAKLPRMGPVFGKLLGAIRMYRSRMGVLFAACLISAAVHVLSTVGIYLIARGLPGESPSLGSHFLIVPLAMVTGVLPLPVNGLGAFEAVVNFLYVRFGGPMAVLEGQGFIVALGYRAATILIAMVGVCFYLTSRREVSQTLREAESELQTATPPAEQSATGVEGGALSAGQCA